MNTTATEKGLERSGVTGPLLYLLFFLSGTAALIYEVMWLREFSLVFGSTTQTTSAVLGAFFGGLAIGGLLGARLATSRAQSLWRYGIAEIAIGAGALLVPVWISLSSALYPALYPLGEDALKTYKLILAFGAMGLPCVAMGTTLPLLARAAVTLREHLGRRVALAYALNTLGATLGVVLAGFVLPPAVGTRWSIYIAVALNLVIGVAAMFMARRSGRFQPDAPEAEDAVVTEPSSPVDSAVWTVVVGSGFGTVALEVLYTRLIVNVTDSSVFSFALILATFLALLAAGSLVVSWAVDRLDNPWKLLAWSQSLAVVAILASPLLFQLSLGSHRTLISSLVGLARQLGFVVAPTILLVSLALPTAWKIASRAAAEAGAKVGRLTAVNTLGAVAGSVVTGFVIVPALGIGGGIALISALYIVIAFVSWQRAYGHERALIAGIAMVVAFTALFMLRTFNTFLLVLEPGQRSLAMIVGESVNVGVVEDPELGRIMKVNNRYVLGRTDRLAVNMQRNQAGLPLLLHPGAKSAAFIGVGTAIAVSPVLDFPLDRVLAIELLAEVVQATPYFKEANRDVLGQAKVETLVADGRNHLFATAETFDVIVGDLFAPWHAGTGYLYTREHFQSVRSRLTTGGLFVQWLPAHQLSGEELRMIAATFLEVFPDAELWLSRPEPQALGSLALIGVDGDSSTLDRAAPQGSSAFPGLEFLCDAQRLGAWAAGAKLNTDEFPRIEFSAAVSRFGGHDAERARDLIASLRSTAEGSEPATPTIGSGQADSGPARVEDLTLRGRRLEAEDRWDEAAASYREAIAVRSDNAPAYLALARLLARSGAANEALAVARQGLEHVPEALPLRSWLGGALRTRRRWDEAEAELLTALAHPDAGAAEHFALGMVYLNTEEWSDARRQLERSVELDGDSIPAWYQLAHACERLNDLEAKRRALARFEELYRGRLAAAKETPQ